MTITEQETRKAIAECTVTKINGQPTNKDIDLLDDELTAIASSFPSKLGGGMHGHAGLIKSAADYDNFAPRTPFVLPPNPGHYPAGPIPAVQRAQREAEHKALIVQFQTCIGVSKGLKDQILTAVDEDYVLELRDEGIAYLNVTPFQMLTHLCDRWGSMDYVDITALLASAMRRGMLEKCQQNTSIESTRPEDSWHAQMFKSTNAQCWRKATMTLPFGNGRRVQWPCKRMQT